MKVTSAKSKDIPSLCELLAHLFSQELEFQPNYDAQSEGLQQIMNSPEIGQILVLRHDETVTGMVNLLFSVSTALGSRVAILEDMIVHPAHRSNGAGSMLLQAAIDFAKSAGCRRITLLTDGVNESAQRFYQRHGFTSSEMMPMRLVL